MRRCHGMLALGLVLLAALPAVADEVRGVLVRVDLDRHELQIEGRGRGRRGLAMTFTLGKDTQVLFGRQAGELKELAPGRRVRVTFDAEMRALTVQVIGTRRPVAGGKLPAPVAEPNVVAGVLQRVSFAERELVVVGPGARGPQTESVIAVPADVKVTKDGKAIPFDDLKDGQPAAVRTEKRGGKLVARSIEVGSGAASAVPAAPEPGGRIARLRRLLQIADQILQQAENMRDNPPPPK